MSALVRAEGLALPGRLKQASLELAAGELVCMIGPNGSGKTSLLHALAGIGTPAGEVRIEGVDPRGLAPGQRQRMLSYLPASREANWPLMAADVVALGLASAKDPERVPAVLEQLGLAEFSGRRVDRMSTGERSRVLIARALVARPKLILLDEPVANLDPLWQLRLMEILAELAHGHGQAVLVALHDLDLARTYADRLIVMNSGRVAADGDPDALFKSQVIADVFGIVKVGGSWRPEA